MPESVKHKKLKQTAMAVLEMQGYDVECEKLHKDARIDVYGTLGGEEVAIEVGDCPNERGDMLEQDFEKFLHIPYEEYGAEQSGVGEDKKRVNVSLNGSEWERFGEIVGERGRSRIVREFIRTYIALEQ